MMEMSKTLGISPKVIGQGGWLGVGNMRASKKALAGHQIRSNKFTRELHEVSLRFKYARLSSIAHEWWHSLDRALGYFNTGKKEPTTTEVTKSAFTGREEVWDAVNRVMTAINNSGYTSRIENLVKRAPRSTREYFLEPTEQAARAFDQYISDRFDAASITIENYDNHTDDTQPTAEEMAIIAPAFDNLFKVLQEKEGKKPGTSVLYRIEGEEFTPTEMQQEVGKYVVKWITDAGYTVHTDINELQEAIKRSESEKTQFLRTDDGVVYGLVQNGEIYLDTALLNPNTPIHEYTHIWDRIIMEQNPQLWEEGKKLLKRLTLWNDIANSEQYKSLQGDEDLIASEVHSRLVGKKGEEVFTQLYERAQGHINEIGIELDLITRIKNWLGQFMDNLKSIILPYNSDKSVSLEEFIAMPLNDLVFNARPRNRHTENDKLYWGEQRVNALSGYATLTGVDIYKFNGHAQQYYSELKNGIGIVVYHGDVYIFDIDSDGLARPTIKLKSYEEARERVDVFNESNARGYNRNLRPKRDRTRDGLYNNSSDGIRGTSENVSPVAERESRRNGFFKTGRQNNRPQDSVGGSSVDSDGLLFRSASIDEEIEAIKNEAIANGTFMKAPNDKPTKLNERQWLQVRTQNFLNWFGDWMNDPENASKVVDENGEPMVVYHGSNAQFTEFDTARIGSTTGTADGRGFYFTTDRDYAEGYVTPEGQLFDVYLNIENPLSYERKTITKAQLRKILKEADRVEFEREGEHYMLSNYANYNDVGIDGAINEAANLEYDYADNDVELVGSLIGGSGSFELIMDAVRKVTGKSGMIAPKDNGTTHYIVTNPSAIKSASAVTYDDAGNVIPLSQRFNPLNPDIRYRGSENNSLSSQSYEGTEDAYTANDGGGIQPETEGVSGEVSVSGPLSEGRKLARPENGKVSQDGFARFNPIHEREGESDNRRNNREAKFLSFVNSLTLDEQAKLYGFLKDYSNSPSGILRGRATDFINSIRQIGNNTFADFVEDFINDELKYREGVSASTAAKHGFIVGISYDVSRLEQIFDAYNNDKYNEALFDRAIKLAKRFGVSIKYKRRGDMQGSL